MYSFDERFTSDRFEEMIRKAEEAHTVVRSKSQEFGQKRVSATVLDSSRNASVENTSNVGSPRWQREMAAAFAEPDEPDVLSQIIEENVKAVDDGAASNHGNQKDGEGGKLINADADVCQQENDADGQQANNAEASTEVKHKPNVNTTRRIDDEVYSWHNSYATISVRGSRHSIVSSFKCSTLESIPKTVVSSSHRSKAPFFVDFRDLEEEIRRSKPCDTGSCNSFGLPQEPGFGMKHWLATEDEPQPFPRSRAPKIFRRIGRAICDQLQRLRKQDLGDTEDIDSRNAGCFSVLRRLFRRRRN